MFCNHAARDNKEMDPTDCTRDHLLLGTALRHVHHQFQGARKYVTPLSRFVSIKQGPNKTLKLYIHHFNDELTTIHNPQENGMMMAAISGVKPKTPF